MKPALIILAGYVALATLTRLGVLVAAPPWMRARHLFGAAYGLTALVAAGICLL